MSDDLRHPWTRDELLLWLAEISDARQTAAWLAPPPDRLAGGIDALLHFLFDDHDFDASAIGLFLPDEGEVAAIEAVKNALEAILETNRRGDSLYFLKHEAWPEVVRAAQTAQRSLSLGAGEGLRRRV